MFSNLRKRAQINILSLQVKVVPSRFYFSGSPLDSPAVKDKPITGSAKSYIHTPDLIIRPQSHHPTLLSAPRAHL